MTRAVAAINLTALKHNFSWIKKVASHQYIWAMIKSSGYGHGLLRVAQVLSEADAFGVSCIEEAIVLREAGIKTPIIVMGGFSNEKELLKFIRHHLVAVIHQPDQVRVLENCHLTSPLSVWLKIDSGMHRLGFSVEVVASIYQSLQKSVSVRKPIGLMTHLADADNIDRAFTEFQINQFFTITKKMKGPKSIVNSAGLLSYPNALVDWVRPGILLYGISPFNSESVVERNLRPVMTLSATIVAIKQCRKDDVVGYGCIWRCPETMPIGIVGIGYGDGYPRHAPNGTPTLLNNKVCPLIGRVSMDMIAIDLRSQPNVQIGDEVILWGNGLPIERIAQKAHTISYELLCNITHRVHFIEVEDESND
ncbi:alanine racemase [Coxiella endosymbiont of Amblyomma nuttalli]|uniref:alanine racemase n=1 Tax=Coxiella endosymbiont of Amblyomma nuttalli TaxID=2749996 RepID=UPI001BACB9BE|nr:alanine racemase [Coxiella endosymbiont of Amblyomma nuttalli]QTS84081.1 Alanine racemase biosynthetic [Coxiella endosymbiont of Amblyomma nuttalli]